MKKKIKIGTIGCGLIFLLLILGIVFRDELNFYWHKYINPEYIDSTCENQSCLENEIICKPDWAYVDISQCQCPEGTVRSIETSEGGEEAVLICRTIPPCLGASFYEQQAASLNYQVHGNFVSISGCLSDSAGAGCQEKILNLSPDEWFYLSSGKEQSVKVILEKIEDNKAYFLFTYGAAPPACQTLGGCDYVCEFVKE